MSVYKIAVLDDYQNISQSHFSQLDPSKFDVTYLSETLLPYNHADTPQSAKDELVRRFEPYHIICTMRERTPFPGDLITQLPNLKLLLTTGLRNASLHLPTFQNLMIPVAGTRPAKPVRVDSTTQHCVALILSLARNIPNDDLAVKSGAWQTDTAIGLAGKTYGVVGLGRLGASTAKIMNVAFDMNIIAWSQNLKQEAADQKAREAGLLAEDAQGEKTFKVVSREELFRAADVVSLHLVLSSRTQGLINSSDLSLMKPSALFVNTSRGPLVVEKDLLDVLKRGSIRGAALDVYDLEPLPANSEWRSQDWGRNGSSRVVMTPHMGYVEEEPLTDWYRQQVENIQRWERGEDLSNVLA